MKVELLQLIGVILFKFGSIKFIWLGHSTLLVNIKNIIVMIDPVISKAASPVSFIVERFQPPVIEL
jgi:L-ascorbate metabolism protein UlaG (beta-lactamase superfamily)